MPTRTPLHIIQSAFFGLDAEQLICTGRAFLALFATIVIYFDPIDFLTNERAALTTLSIYSAYAVMLAIFSFRTFLSSVPQVIAHFVDVLVCLLLMHFTGGATSPFFVLLIFALLASTLRWGWLGTAIASIVIVATYLGYALAEIAVLGTGTSGEMRIVVVRGGFLLLLGAMHTYASANMQRNKNRLTQLWTGIAITRASDRYSAVSQSMTNAANLIGVQRIVTLWHGHDETDVTIAYQNGDEFQIIEAEDEIPITFPGDEPCFLRDPGSLELHLRSSTEKLAAPILTPGFAATFSVRAFFCAPFRTPYTRGFVLILDPPGASDNTFTLAEIIASRISNELVHIHNLSASENFATLRERIRISRDLHDGVLQNLGAVNLQLQRIVRRSPPDIAAALQETMTTLIHQQAIIRATIQSDNPKSDERSGSTPHSQIQTFAARIGELWGCALSVEISPNDLAIPPSLTAQLYLILSEATANAVRHGTARNLRIAVKQMSNELVLTLRDDGIGVATQPEMAETSKATPFYLTQRVKELGGTISYLPSEKGAALSIRVPLS